MNERAKGVSILRIRDLTVIKLPAYRITVIANFKKNIPLVKPVKFHRSIDEKSRRKTENGKRKERKERIDKIFN